MISFFLERIRRNVRSFWGSMSLTVPLAFIIKLCIKPAYCTVEELSMVLLMGIPAECKRILGINYLRHYLIRKSWDLNFLLNSFDIKSCFFSYDRFISTIWNSHRIPVHCFSYTFLCYYSEILYDLSKYHKPDGGVIFIEWAFLGRGTTGVAFPPFPHYQPDCGNSLIVPSSPMNSNNLISEI